MMRDLVGWVLIFICLAAAPALIVWLSLFNRRRTVWMLSAYEREPISTLTGETRLPPPPRTPLFSPLRTTGIRHRRTGFASHVPPSDGLVTETWRLDCPSAPELPTEPYPETRPGAPDEAWSGRGGSFGGVGTTGLYGGAEAPSSPSEGSCSVSCDASSSCGNSGDGSD